MYTETKSLRRIYTKITCGGKQITGSIIYLTSKEVHITTRYSIQSNTLVQLEFVPLKGRIVQLKGKAKQLQKSVPTNQIDMQSFNVNTFKIIYTCENPSDLELIKRYLKGQNVDKNTHNNSVEAKIDKDNNSKKPNHASHEEEKMKLLRQRITELEKQNDILTYENIARKKADNELRAFYDLTCNLSSASDINGTMNFILETIVHIDGIDSAGLCIVDKKTGGTRLEYNNNLPDGMIEFLNNTDSDSPQIKLIMGGAPIYDHNLLIFNQTNNPTLDGIRSCAVVPILKNEKVIAAIGFCSRSLNEILIDLQKEIETIASHTGAVMARLQAEEELYLFKSVMESSVEAISICYPDGQLKYVNPAYENLFGRSLKNGESFNFHEYYPPDAAEIVDKTIIPILKSGKTWQGTLEVFNANKKQIPVHIISNLVFNKTRSSQFLFSIIHDISE